MRFTAGTTAEGKPAVYLRGAFVRASGTAENASNTAALLNQTLGFLLDERTIRAELACIFLNAGEKEPKGTTIPHTATLTVHDVEVSGDVNEAGDAALNWTPDLLNAIGEQLREQLGERCLEEKSESDFAEAKRQEGL